MSSASHNIIIQEDSNHHCYGIPETTELCPLFIVSEDYKGYESIKFTDIKFYPSKVMEQQLYSYKYTWYWRKANFHDGVIVTSKTDLRSLLTNKKVPWRKVRCLKNEWFYSSADHYRYSGNRTLAIIFFFLVVYFILCFLNLGRSLRTMQIWWKC